MYTKRDTNDNYVFIKLEIERIKIPIFNFLALIKEIDLYPNWFPTCKKAEIVAEFPRGREMCNFIYSYPYPFDNRISQLFGSGLNLMRTDKSIVVLARSTCLIDQFKELPILRDIQFPQNKDKLPSQFV